MKTWLQRVFGVHEVLFLTGFGGFFYGISQKWTIFDAFLICGAILMVIAVFSIIFAQKRAG